MIKKVLLIFGLILAMLFICSSCEQQADMQNLNVESAEYVLKYEVWNQNAQYIFVLTPENTILAQYKDSESNYEDISVELKEKQVSMMKPYVDEILTLSKEDIIGYFYVTDFWYVKLCFANKEIWYDYSASENASVNLILEEMIRCCDFENNKFLLP